MEPVDLSKFWVPRLDGERTSDYLARVLDEVGADDMARRARLGHFDDYFCPDEVDDGANIHRLVKELSSIARSTTYKRRRQLQAITVTAKEGEFDGTKEESEEWARSPDGQAVFNELIEGR